MSVRCFELMCRILGAVQRHEESFHVAVKPALAHLVSVDLHERVVAAFGAHRQLEAAKGTGISARARRRRQLREFDRRKEPIRCSEYIRRCEMTAIEVAHMTRYGTAEGFSLWTSCLQSMRSRGCSESRRN